MTPHEIVAFHEAGHAVADLRAGLQVIEARIYGTRGHVEPAGHHDYRIGLPDQPTTADLVNAWAPYAIASLAGPAAQARICGAGNLRPCGEVDVAHVEGFLRQIVDDPDDFETVASWLTSHACWLVSQEWAAIERVATALLERKVLTGEQVAERAA